MKDTVFTLTKPNGQKEEYAVTNFDEETESANWIHSYTLRNSEDTIERFLIENPGTTRALATNVYYRPHANADAVARFFDLFMIRNSDPMVTYSRFKYTNLYFLCELRGCKPLDDSELRKESFETRAQILKSILDMIIDIDCASLYSTIDPDYKAKYQSCTFGFSKNAFYYSSYTGKAYPVDFNGLKLNDNQFKRLTDKKKLNDLDFYLIRGTKYRTLDLTEFMTFLKETLNSEGISDSRRRKVAELCREKDADRISSSLKMLSIVPEKAEVNTISPFFPFFRSEEDKGFNPLINYLLGQIEDNGIQDSDVRTVINIEEMLRELYSCTSSRRLPSIVRELENSLESLGGRCLDYRQYRTHSLNAEYARRLYEDCDVKEALERSKLSFEAINYVYYANRGINDKHFRAYISACLAESAWLVCLGLHKVGTNTRNNDQGYGFKQQYYSLYNVKDYAKDAIRLYEEIYDEEPNVINAKRLATACRNLGVYLENYKVKGLIKNYDYVKDLFTRAYELMCIHNPDLDNPKIFHCLISLNIKIAKESISYDEFIKNEVRNFRDYAESLRLSNKTDEALAVLNENEEYLMEMADKGFSKSEKYCLLKMMNDYYLCILDNTSERKALLKNSVDSYHFFASDDKNANIRDYEFIKELLK